MNGGTVIPAGGGEISLWCLYQGAGANTAYGQVAIIQLDGFF
jgi:hypothetical protein